MSSSRHWPWACYPLLLRLLFAASLLVACFTRLTSLLTFAFVSTARKFKLLPKANGNQSLPLAALGCAGLRQTKTDTPLGFVL